MNMSTYTIKSIAFTLLLGTLISSAPLAAGWGWSFFVSSSQPQQVKKQPQRPKLSQFNYSGASVMPTYQKSNGEVMVILGREAGGRDKGTYDDFGGKRDAGEDHPEITAAREFFEEMNLGATACTTLRAMRKHINIDAGNTQYILARKSKRSVAYITDFSSYWNRVRKNFYPERSLAVSGKYREKDHLVVTPWSKLREAIEQSIPGQPVVVQAYAIKANGDYAKTPTWVPLRPFFVTKLRPFFQDEAYTKGRHKKIRFYQ